MPLPGGLLSMGSIRTAKAERRMKDKLQQEVGSVMNLKPVSASCHMTSTSLQITEFMSQP
jgi:hypothetical protein